MGEADPAPKSSESIDARGSQGFIYQPSGPVEQVFIEAEKAYDVRGLPNPYLGLRAFTYDDREAYAGREALVEESVVRLTDPAMPQSLLFITGDSGSGKSSFAQAGLLPALEAHYRKRDQTVRLAVFRPGVQPLAALADALSQLGLAFAAQSIQQADPETFCQQLVESTPTNQVNLVVIDQFEELFTQSAAEQRDWFFAFLKVLPPFSVIRTHLVATLRSDYLKELFQEEALWRVAKDGVELRLMSAASLQAAILGPLEARGRKDERYRHKQFAPDLLERLVQDAGQDASYLPLLQVTLEDLWQRGALTLGAYAGLGEAIRRRAEAVYAFRDFEQVQPSDPRPAEERETLLELLLDQIEVSTDDDPRRDVRRRREKEDLISDSILRGALVEDLTRARLLAVGQESHGEASVETVDIIHESLIANWERLREAIAGRREQLKNRRRFEEALDEWSDKGKSADYLLAGVRLAEGRNLRDAGDVALRSEAAREFLAESEAQAEAVHQRELDKERRRARTARIFSAAIGVVLLIAIIAALVASRQTNLLSQEKSTSEMRRVAAENALATAEFQSTQISWEKATSEARRMAAEAAQATANAEQRISRSRELAAFSLSEIQFNPEIALLIALKAEEVTYTFEAEDALRRSLIQYSLLTVLIGHEGEVNHAEFSPDGARVVTASNDNSARLWEAATGEELVVLSGHEGEVNDAEFSPEGERVVTASNDNTARLWDTATGEELAVLRGHDNWVNNAHFSPEGERVVTASRDRTARVWDAATGVELVVLRGHEGEVNHAEFSSDGARVVTASYDNTVRLWDAATGDELVVLSGHEGEVYHAEFSPDGARVVTASYDNSARLWDGATGEELAVLRGHVGLVLHAEFSPDGARVVTASYDNTVRLWDAATGDELVVLRGHDNWVNNAHFSPDGARVMTASRDSTARVWDASTGSELAVLYGHENWVRCAQFSPDGERMVTASRDGTARIWTASTGSELAVLRGHEWDVYDAQFSPDGEQVLTASRDSTARLWDAATGEELAVLRGHVGLVLNARFSPDGTRVVTASNDNTARLWDAATGEELAVLRGHVGLVLNARFSPDGTRVVTASYDNTARLWDATTGEEMVVLRGHDDDVRTAHFSLDGTRVVTASRDSTARVWDAATGEELAVLRGHDNWVNNAQFSPDATRVVTAGRDRTARVWDAATGDELVRLRGHEYWVNNAEFSPDGTRVVTASFDRTARLWDAATGEELAVLRGHEDDVRTAHFSPDGARVVSASFDNTARLWDAATGENLAVLRGHDNWVNNAQFSPDGTRVVTASADSTARLYFVHLEDLVAVAYSRITRELTCDERVHYLHENLTCPTPTSP